MAQYFKDLWLGVSTVTLGMIATFKHFFQPNITIQYPKETLQMYPRSRTKLVNTIEDCGYCLSCERVCPVNIFTIKGTRVADDAPEYILPDGKPRKMNVVQFDIDMSKCVFCGLCVDACDTKSLHWEQPQEPSGFNREMMFREFSDFSYEDRDRMLKEEEARKAAAAAERAAKAKAKPATEGEAGAAKPRPKPKAKAEGEGEE